MRPNDECVRCILSWPASRSINFNRFSDRRRPPVIDRVLSSNFWSPREQVGLDGWAHRYVLSLVVGPRNESQVAMEPVLTLLLACLRTLFWDRKFFWDQLCSNVCAERVGSSQRGSMLFY